ncbi:MAG: response regulator [Verrucomicrobia bacterium]|nr:response regulator [Verrucomicrobiota bacterium]
MNGETGFNLVFAAEHLKAALAVSLLSVWVLVALFHYLNRYTKRRYFTIWTAAWLFYAVWLTIGYTMYERAEPPLVLLFKQWCIAASSVCLLWGAAQFLQVKSSQLLMGLYIGFLFTWGYVGAYDIESELRAAGPMFILMGVTSGITAWCFFKMRRRREFLGSTLLFAGFLLWGVYMAAYPFLQQDDQLISAGHFIAAVLQLFIAVSMIILVLEEARRANESVVEQIKTHRTETEMFRARAVSTEERYRSLFDQASEAIIIAAAGDLRILELNKAAGRLLGLGGGAVHAPPLPQFCQFKIPDAPPKTGAEWFALIQGQPAFTVTRADGSAARVEVDGAPIQFDGRPAYQFFFREITEQARLEQQLRQSEKLSALGRMISGIAHELNNPLTVVKGYLELILARHELQPQTREDLKKVAQESNRAAKLVGNFLSFARQQAAHRAPVDVNALATHVAEMRRFDSRVASVEMILDLAPEIPSVAGDKDQIQQVLVNLVTNALQALSEAPFPRRLALRTRAENGLIQIRVEDNGPGVPEHLVPRIFEPFFTTKEVGVGTGLGLSIVHSIMADHQGRVFYQKEPGSGACFVLEFPTAGAAVFTAVEEPEKSVVTEISPATTPTARILILDDEKSIAELLGEMLGILGYKTTLCHAAPPALELIERCEFDLILSDIRMPTMDGKQFYKAVAAKRPELAQRIIFLTGDVVAEETQSFLASIGNHYLSKPFQLSKVEAIVAQVLREHAAAKD